MTLARSEHMSARYPLFLCALLALPLETLANSSCGLHAAGLLSSGKTQELSALFAEPPEVVAPLQSMVNDLGKISDVQESSKPRFAQHKRVSVQAKNPAASLQYHGYWINALSEKLGPVQFHFASAPGSACKLLAVHLDIEI